MANIQKKSTNMPDETKEFPNALIKTAKLDGITFNLATYQPGWKWSEDIKPTVKTESCQMKHTAYVISGRLHTKTDDGQEQDLGPGDVGIIPPGHDGWVVGDEPVQLLDITIG